MLIRVKTAEHELCQAHSIDKVYELNPSPQWINGNLRKAAHQSEPRI